jgi:hypothetical protein
MIVTTKTYLPITTHDATAAVAASSARCARSFYSISAYPHRASDIHMQCCRLPVDSGRYAKDSAKPSAPITEAVATERSAGVALLGLQTTAVTPQLPAKSTTGRLRRSIHARGADGRTNGLRYRPAEMPRRSVPVISTTVVVAVVVRDVDDETR